MQCLGLLQHFRRRRGRPHHHEAFTDIGATDIILNPTVGDQDEIARLADIVL